MNQSTLYKSAMAVLGLWAAGFSAAPIEKTGPCPTLTRYTAPSSDNWGSFPVKPGGFTSGTIQNPLSPDSSINCIIVPPGLKPQIVASERTPGVNSPLPMSYIMEFTFDERGRVWAIEPRDYPYTHAVNGRPDSTVSGISTSAGLPSNRLAGRGRVLILTDADGDGSLDNYKVFYEGLALPTSVELVKGGVIAIVPPNIYYIPASTSNPDTAGGAAQIIVSNMGSTGTNYDSHGQTNSLTWGIDNFMYGGVGYNSCGTPSVAGGNSLTSCPTGSIYRFKSTTMGSDTNLVQLFGNSSSGTNSHGIGQTEDGQWFSSKATVTNHSHHVVRLGQDTRNILPTNYNCPNTGGTVANCDSTHNFFPATRDFYAWEGSTARAYTFNGVTVYGTNSSAVSGHDFYTATLLPSEYRRRSFVCEGMSHLCNQNDMSVRGSTWLANRRYGGPNGTADNISNIFSSTDAWVAPLKVRTGPDGALWVLDFYNYLFLHNPASPATNAAWINALREKSRVRIYRIVPADGSTQPVLNLSNATVTQLVAALGHSNMFWRTTAQRLLLNRTYATGERETLLNTLQNILETNKTYDTAFGTSPQVLHAMWVVAGMKQYTFAAQPARWDSTFKKLLLHPAWTVRRNALLAMPPTQTSSDAIVAQCAVNDVHPHVRIQALAALIANPAPTTPATMVTSFKNTDVAGNNSTPLYSSVAFTAAGTTKVTEVAGTERPSTCPAYSAGVAVRQDKAARSFARNDLRFETSRDGFTLKNSLQLGSGELKVSDLRGKVVFRSTYNAAQGNWSTPTARNLSLPVYFYTYREIGGASFNGRIALAPQFQ